MAQVFSTRQTFGCGEAGCGTFEQVMQDTQLNYCIKEYESLGI